MMSELHSESCLSNIGKALVHQRCAGLRQLKCLIEHDCSCSLVSCVPRSFPERSRLTELLAQNSRLLRLSGTPTRELRYLVAVDWRWPPLLACKQANIFA